MTTHTHTHSQTEAAPELGAPEFSERLLYCTGGVKTFGQQQQSVEEKEGGQTVDHILEIFYTETQNMEQ